MIYGLSLSTVNVYLAAVSNFCTEHDYIDPVKEPAVLRAVKVTFGFVILLLMKDDQSVAYYAVCYRYGTTRSTR